MNHEFESEGDLLFLLWNDLVLFNVEIWKNAYFAEALVIKTPSVLSMFQNVHTSYFFSVIHNWHKLAKGNRIISTDKEPDLTQLVFIHLTIYVHVFNPTSCLLEWNEGAIRNYVVGQAETSPTQYACWVNKWLLADWVSKGDIDWNKWFKWTTELYKSPH